MFKAAGFILKNTHLTPLAERWSEGVLVLIYWKLEGDHLYIRRAAGVIQAFRTTTNEQGIFEFPAWGPIKIPEHLPSNASPRTESPRLILYKRGYDIYSLSRHQSRNEPTLSKIKWGWNGMTLKMKSM